MIKWVKATQGTNLILCRAWDTRPGSYALSLLYTLSLQKVFPALCLWRRSLMFRSLTVSYRKKKSKQKLTTKQWNRGITRASSPVHREERAPKVTCLPSILPKARLISSSQQTIQPFTRSPPALIAFVFLSKLLYADNYVFPEFLPRARLFFPSRRPQIEGEGPQQIRWGRSEAGPPMADLFYFCFLPMFSQKRYINSWI